MSTKKLCTCKNKKVEQAKQDIYNNLLVELIHATRAPRLSLSIEDATMLVYIAVKYEAITMSRAAELLGTNLEYTREQFSNWMISQGESIKPEEHEPILPEEEVKE